MRYLFNLRSYKEFKSWVIPIVTSIVAVLFIRKFVFMISYIPSTSMVHTLEVGDRLFCVNVMLLDDIKRQDIIVFKHSVKNKEQLLVKRVIGLPGDKVRIDKGVVYVNGEKLQEDYLGSHSDYTGSFAVPDDKYLVLGDNRAVSSDGSRWANPFIEVKDVKYKALFRVYPFNRFGNFTN